MAGTEPASRASPLSVSLPSLGLNCDHDGGPLRQRQKRALRTLLRLEEGLIKNPERESSAVPGSFCNIYNYNDYSEYQHEQK
jgi:hypothetical protein